MTFEEMDLRRFRHAYLIGLSWIWAFEIGNFVYLRVYCAFLLWKTSCLYMPYFLWKMRKKKEEKKEKLQ